MGLYEAVGRTIARLLSPGVELPRPVRYYERYPGLGPLQWSDNIGPETKLTIARLGPHRVSRRF